jgi:hypothetical protein
MSDPSAPAGRDTPRVNPLAAASLALACLLPPLLLVALVLLGQSSHEQIGGVLYVAAATVGVLGLVTAVAALVQMRLRPGRYTGAWFAAAALILTLLPTVLLVVFPLLARVRR